MTKTIKLEDDTWLKLWDLKLKLKLPNMTSVVYSLLKVEELTQKAMKNE